MPALTSIGSDFPTPEKDAGHDAWFRAKVAAALASDAKPVAHDVVMAEARAIIEARQQYA